MPQRTGAQLLYGTPVTAGVTMVVRMGVGGAPKFKQQRGGAQTVRANNSFIQHLQPVLHGSCNIQRGYGKCFWKFLQ